MTGFILIPLVVILFGVTFVNANAGRIEVRTLEHKLDFFKFGLLVVFVLHDYMFLFVYT